MPRWVASGRTDTTTDTTVDVHRWPPHSCVGRAEVSGYRGRVGECERPRQSTHCRVTKLLTTSWRPMMPCAPYGACCDTLVERQQPGYQDDADDHDDHCERHSETH